ncbi:MAG: hypothetical protein ACI9WC_000153 [Arenicella sp.]|jgi:hypothetical protein
MKSHYIALGILMVSALISLPSYASSGTVILAKGVVTATSVGSSSRVLAKGGAIDEGDVVNTAGKSFAVIRMLDNTKLTLKPGTTIAIGKFSTQEGKEEGCINLVKGGLRTVTGLIGKRRPDAFQVDTPIASIGIRGTDFITRICAGDECLVDEQELGFGDYSGKPKTSQSTEIAELINQQLPEGLYGSCETGAIVMSKCAGQSEGFRLGKCRISQQKDCAEVGLSEGAAGYTSFELVSSADPATGDTPPAGAASLSKPPVILPRTPLILSKDPYFQLSDMSDADLHKVKVFPKNIGTGSGQCSIYGG